MRHAYRQRGTATTRRQSFNGHAVAAVAGPDTPDLDLQVVSLLCDRQDALARVPWINTLGARN
ncbi:MAG: hypothetical protein KC442_22315, partial [Thermomicrobiales bacterium]|nr:hypothetical protein [Thermomicrobiales bacterium]